MKFIVRFGFFFMTFMFLVVHEFSCALCCFFLFNTDSNMTKHIQTDSNMTKHIQRILMICTELRRAERRATIQAIKLNCCSPSTVGVCACARVYETFPCTCFHAICISREVHAHSLLVAGQFTLFQVGCVDVLSILGGACFPAHSPLAFVNQSQRSNAPNRLAPATKPWHPRRARRRRP